MGWPNVRKMMEGKYSKLNADSEEDEMPIDDSVGSRFLPVHNNTGIMEGCP